MKKLLVIGIFSFIIAPLSLFGQNRSIQRFEFEVAGGGIYPNVRDGIPAAPGFQVLGEFRYNISDLFDVGLQVLFNEFCRDNFLISEYHTYSNYALYSYSDYNWRAARDLNFFLGAGVGASFIEDYKYFVHSEDGKNQRDKMTYFSVSPRFGVELFNQLRLTVEYKLPGFPFNWNGYAYSYFGVNIGYAFGGRNK